MMEIQCPAPDCQYKTPEMEAQLAMQLLMLHNANVHESANRQGCKPEAMKTCLDAWNWYHSVQLDKNSRKMTSFITPWGVYRYRTAPQGYLASGDA